MANPRKFSEKIALQKQKQAEGTAEFERIMKEVHATKMDETQVNQKILEHCLTSGNNTISGVNANVVKNLEEHENSAIKSANSSGIGGGVVCIGGVGIGGVRDILNDAQNSENNIIDDNNIGRNVNNDGVVSGGGTSPLTIASSSSVPTSAPATGPAASTSSGRESRGRSIGVGPMRRPERKQDRSPYGSAIFNNVTTSTGTGTNFYLSPPTDSSWRRSNSDSALHQSLNMAVAAEMDAAAADISSGLLSQQQQSHINANATSPHMARRLSNAAQILRLKNGTGSPLAALQQQQQQHQQQQHNFHLHMQQRQLQQQQQQQQHMQQQQIQQQHNYVQQHQQHMHFNNNNNNNNNKYLDCNISSPAGGSSGGGGSYFLKTFQDQSLTFANTGSLPDLTSLHYANGHQQQQLHQQQQQQQQQLQQQILSPLTLSHLDNNNFNNERDHRTPSPYALVGEQISPSDGSFHHQQQQQQTMNNNNNNFAQNTISSGFSANVSFANSCTQQQQSDTITSPKSPISVSIALSTSGNGLEQQHNLPQQLMRSNLPTLGAASSAGNLTEYRQPLNPPSPGSSPGLLTSASGNELHMSAPASPIRYMNANAIGNNNLQQQQQQQPAILQQTFDGIGIGDNSSCLSPSTHFGGSQNTLIDNNRTNSYNQLNSSFHNHFKQFSLGDSNSSPEQQQQQHQQQNHQNQQQQFNINLTHDYGLDYMVEVADELIEQQQRRQQQQLQQHNININDITVNDINSCDANSSLFDNDALEIHNSNNINGNDNDDNNNNNNNNHNHDDVDDDDDDNNKNFVDDNCISSMIIMKNNFTRGDDNNFDSTASCSNNNNDNNVKNKQQQQHQKSYSQRKQQQQLSNQQQQQQRLINKNSAIIANNSISSISSSTSNKNQRIQSGGSGSGGGCCCNSSSSGNSCTCSTIRNALNQINNKSETNQQQQHQQQQKQDAVNCYSGIPSPSSPLPIPVAVQSPLHQQAHSPHLQQQQSPLHSPHFQHQHMQHRFQQQQENQSNQSKNNGAQMQQQHHPTTNISSAVAVTTTTATDQQHQQQSLMQQHQPHHQHHHQEQQQLSSSPLSSPIHSPAAHTATYNNVHKSNNDNLNSRDIIVATTAPPTTFARQQQQQFNQLSNADINISGNTQTTNIPSIIFSDYSSSAEIFDALDLETLGSMDDVGLQMLSDQNGIIITDPNIEDSFRRDFN